MNRFYPKQIIGVLLLFFTFILSISAQTDYKIEAVRGNVYRFIAGNYVSVFMVTEKEIVVADPISKESATWLKAELSKRFKQPIRYVIYSHNHPDHAYGGEIFDGDGVDFIAHELAREDLVRTKAQTRIPNLVFKDEMTLHFGENRVRLRYHGVNNGRGSISMLFEPANVLHVVDWVIVGRIAVSKFAGLRHRRNDSLDERHSENGFRNFRRRSRQHRNEKRY